VAKNIITSSLLIIAAALLQSTLLAQVVPYRAVPDIALLILVYTSYQRGVMTGQITGFASGIFLDFLSYAPLGFNAFIRVIIGAASGLLRGFSVDAVFLPALLAAAATLSKAALALALHILFAGATPAYSLRTPSLWLELAFNMVLSPFIFALLRFISMSQDKNAKGLVRK